MQKTLFSIAAFFILFTSIFAQSSNSQDSIKIHSCYVISIVKKQLSVQPLNTMFNQDGMILLKNGVYDFKINGENAPFCRILAIQKDTFMISYPRYIKNKTLVYDTLAIPIGHKDLALSVSSLHEGVRGLDEIMSRTRYKIEILKLPLSEKKLIENPKVCDNKDCLHPLPANYYLTQLEWKPLYIENGAVCLLDTWIVTKPRLRKNKIK